MKIIAGNMHFQKLNEAIRDSREDDILLVNCEGQRYIASGMSQKRIVICLLYTSNIPVPGQRLFEHG